MGFGTLFFGYFVTFAFSFSRVYYFADIIGAVIVIWAFSKLAEYNRYFNGAMVSVLVFLVLCTVNASNLIFKWYPSDGALDLLVDLGKLISACVMHVFFFLGTGGICEGAEAEPLVKKTRRDFVATMIYYGASLLTVALSGVLGDKLNVVSASILLYWALCLVLNLALIYQCFGILMPEEGDGEKKQSKIPFLRFLDNKFDELDDKKNEYRRESMQMAWDEAGRRAAEKEKNKNQKHPHKKKKK